MSVLKRVERDGNTMTLWRRCDLCRWSGPAGRFVALYKDGGHADICLHAWCWGNDFTRQQLFADGWGEVPYRSE